MINLRAPESKKEWYPALSRMGATLQAYGIRRCDAAGVGKVARKDCKTAAGMVCLQPCSVIGPGEYSRQDLC